MVNNKEININQVEIEKQNLIEIIREKNNELDELEVELSLLDFSQSREISDLRSKKSSLEEEIKEKELLIKELTVRAERGEEDAEIHFKALTKTSKKWNEKKLKWWVGVFYNKLLDLNTVRNWTIEHNEKLYNIKTKDLENQISDKTKEIAEKTERLEISNKMIKSRDAEISELKRQLQKEKERAEKTNKIILEKDLQNKNLTKENEELQSRLHLAENNLLALPNKKQSKFKLFKEKTKTKLQQFKQLIKEELVCKVEVRNK